MVYIEWVLMTGGCSGAIRYWDIVHAGCFLVLDQSKSQLGRQPPSLDSSVAEKAAASKATGQSSSAKDRGQQKITSFGNGAKLSASSRMSSQLKFGYAKQRRHPGMISSQEHATAHYGAVTGLKATEDGMYLLSTGSDSRLRLWDVESGCNISEL